MREPIPGVTLARAYRAATAIFLAALLVSLGFDSIKVSLGVAAGFALGLSVLWSWQVVVLKALDPAAPRRFVAAALALLKLPVLGAVVWLLFTHELVQPGAFAVGLAIPQVAVALLTIGARAPARPRIVREREVHAAPRA